jgi:hypothetical protein
MNQITLDQDWRKKLPDLNSQTTFLDEDGKAVGFFLPLATYRKILSSIPIPFSEEELERRKNEPGGGSLEEIWKRLGVK